MLKYLLSAVVVVLVALEVSAIGGIGGGTLNSYTWSADGATLYPPNADGSFNVNPYGGITNLWVGTNRLTDIIGSYVVGLTNSGAAELAQ